jgi:uncharacterized membrane protein (UPF0127 family)
LTALRVRNVTRGTLIADRASMAGSSAERRTGLLKHNELLPGEGLWIAPCECVHTFGMKFAIDAIFLTKNKRVAKIAANLPRRRIALAIWADSVLELPAGTAARTNTCEGDQLALERSA